MKENKPARSGRRKWAVYSGVAFQMLAIIGLGTYGGVKLDEAHPNEYSIYTIICSLASIGIALYFVIKQVNSQKNER